MEFTVYRDKAGQYRWRITSRNHRILADSSEGYNRKSVAVASIRRLVRGMQAMPMSVEVSNGHTA